MVLLQEEDLNIIKSLELEIALEIKRICDEYDIKYSIAFGTLLGAVRHGGFIPWDDDIDIAMIRSEYDKFLNAAYKCINSRFEIVNYETNDKIGEPFTKIMLKGSVMQEKFAENTGAPCGVFVDVFPFDASPDNNISRMIHRFLNYELRKRILIASKYNFNKTGLKGAIYKALSFISKDKQKLVERYRINQNRYNTKETRNVVAMGGNYGYTKDTVPRDWFNEYVEIDFEGEKFSAFAQTEDFLKHYYGDYLKLPPIEQRINKHTVAKLDLTKYGGRKV